LTTEAAAEAATSITRHEVSVTWLMGEAQFVVIREVRFVNGHLLILKRRVMKTREERSYLLSQVALVTDAAIGNVG
jgi:hypothetical protein